MFVPWLRINLFLVVILLSCNVGWASNGKASEPIVITSKSLAVHNQANKAIFDGEVLLVQGAFRLTADRMVVFFISRETSEVQDDPAAPAVAGKKVSTIKAAGHVKILNGDQSASGKKAMYYAKEEKVVLTGKPEVWQEGYRVTGEKITLFLKDDRSVVEGGSQVVITDSDSLSLGTSKEAKD